MTMRKFHKENKKIKRENNVLYFDTKHAFKHYSKKRAK